MGVEGVGWIHIIFGAVLILFRHPIDAWLYRMNRPFVPSSWQEKDYRSIQPGAAALIFGIVLVFKDDPQAALEALFRVAAVGTVVGGVAVWIAAGLSLRFRHHRATTLMLSLCNSMLGVDDKSSPLKLVLLGSATVGFGSLLIRMSAS
ncbi:MAG: hypothetical protein O2884_06135 [Chloroflexi bacterium]|nr:hypothetical protein [Chloroflexota bacterium]